MSIEVKMPALSPTMEAGTLARWLVGEGDLVKPGDILAEIETDKATMEFEAIEEGRIARIVIPAGEEDVAVGTVIALIGDANAVEQSRVEASPSAIDAVAVPAAEPEPVPASLARERSTPIESRAGRTDQVKISPLAARIATARGIDLEAVEGTGQGGRIVRRDLLPPAAASPPGAVVSPAPAAARETITEIPHDMVNLSTMRKTIARRLTESKQQVPHIYLTVDIVLDKLLALRVDLNAALAQRGIKLSVNDMVVKALASALIETPVCNVEFADDQLLRFRRADISVAVSIPNGLITPVVVDAGSKSLSAIAAEMKDLAARARDGKLQPHEYRGGTASLSNLGMFGIKQFEAVINPPQAMIMAVGAGEKRAIVVEEAVQIATVMSATGSFDHRAIDGADAAQLMQAFKRLIESPMLLL